MIVIGIAAMIMAIGVPAIFGIFKKDPMRQAISDVVEACSEARARAILGGYPTEVVFDPPDYTFHIGSVPTDSSSDSGGPALSTGDGPAPAAAPRPGKSWSRTLSDQLILEMLNVNFVELKDADTAHVRFFPNGTSDEFTIVLQWPEHHTFRKITLDSISGLSDVEEIQ